MDSLHLIVIRAPCRCTLPRVTPKYIPGSRGRSSAPNLPTPTPDHTLDLRHTRSDTLPTPTPVNFSVDPITVLNSLIVVHAYKISFISQPATDPAAVDYCWRLLIGFGCVPGFVAPYFRLTIPETPRFTLDVDRNMKQAVKDVEGHWKGIETGPDNSVVTTKVDVPKASWADS